MLANYGDVIPRKEYEDLDANHKELVTQYDEKSKEFDTLKADHEWVKLIWDKKQQLAEDFMSLS